MKVVKVFDKEGRLLQPGDAVRSPDWHGFFSHAEPVHRRFPQAYFWDDDVARWIVYEARTLIAREIRCRDLTLVDPEQTESPNRKGTPTATPERGSR